MNRLQWPEDQGYSGETSLQTAALHHGAWLSLKEIREVGRGKLSLHDNDTDQTKRTFQRALVHYDLKHESCVATQKHDFIH